jgi:hypothetical protein
MAGSYLNPAISVLISGIGIMKFQKTHPNFNIQENSPIPQDRSKTFSTIPDSSEL